MNKKNTIVMVEALLAVMFWGASFVATKVELRDVLPVKVVWIRFGIGLIILGAVVLYRRQMALPNLKEMGYFALLGFLGITFHQWQQSTGLETAQATTTAWIFCTGLAYVFWYDALQFLPASQAGAFLYFEPLVTVVVAAVILGEPLLLASLSGRFIILIGVWIVNLNWKKMGLEKGPLVKVEKVSEGSGD